MYGSQSSSNHPGHHHHHKAPGPPQPEWRLSPTPQSQQPSWHHLASPPPPPPPPPPAGPAYNPSTYGPIHGPSPVNTNAPLPPLPGTLAAADTTKWGVRYNQQHTHAPTPPPLPPRPTSSTEQQQPVTSTAVSPPPPSAPAWTAPPVPELPPASAAGPQPWAADSDHGSQQLNNPLPPPPPPIPPGYQSELQQQGAQAWQQPPHTPATHHYDPQQAAFAPSAPYGPQNQYGQTTPLADRPLPPLPPGAQVAVAPYVSPPMSASALPVTTVTAPATSASALGAGSPSDWEHFSPAAGDIDDTDAFRFKQENVPQPTSSQELPTAHSPVVPTSVSPSPSQGAISPPVSSPSQCQAGGPFTVPRKPSPSQLAKQGTLTPPPAQLPRVDTLSSTTSAASIDSHAEGFDDAIQAWNRPISPGAQQTNSNSQQGSVSTVAPQSPAAAQQPVVETSTVQESAIESHQQTSSKKGSPIEKPPPTPPKDTPVPNSETVSPQPKVDPYEDLDPWSKSSLERYVKMLRQEAVAESDEERYKIFTAFTAKETKLREILYNIEPNKDAKPPARSKTVGEVESGLIPLEPGEHAGLTHAQTFTITTSDSMLDESGSYSPGGRPILSVQTVPERRSSLGLHRSASNPALLQPQRALTPASHVPRSTSVPPHTMAPLISNPPQPVYTPFRYAEGPQRGSDPLVFDRPAYQAYSDLRQASAESGRVMSHTPAPTSRGRTGTFSSSPARNEHDETFLGLIREKSVTYRGRRRGSASPVPPLPDSLRRGRSSGAIGALHSLIPSPFPKDEESPWNADTRKDLEKYPDDFRYIQEAVQDWERSAKERREKLDKERMERQEESEKHIDTLFNDREIGYADINHLEEEFRQTEARKQLDEERQELDKFIADVFNPMDKRLQDEITTLKAQYELAINQLDTESSWAKDSAVDKYQLSHTMKNVIDIYQKLERRYQKRLDIGLDRERRRKKAERRPLVFLGDSHALKTLDGEFDRMEKRNILEAAKQRDERANRLMDSFDDAIMRGLGEHQSLLDDISAKVKKLDPKTINSTGIPTSEVEQILRSVSALVKFIGTDSESILRSFGVTDSTLNNADYSVSVAEARYSNADVDVFRRLDEEKKKEDAKIKHDLESKLESVRKGPAEIGAKIDKLLEAMGKEPGPGSGPWGRPPGDEPENESEGDDETVPENHPTHVLMPGPRPTATPSPGRMASPSRVEDEDAEKKERLRKALEEAKRRNAAKNFTS